MPLLAVERVRKSYLAGDAPVEAVREVSLDVEAGEFVALVGPSGCGKSTLLHLCGGMDRPTSGGVALEARRLDTLDDEALTRVRRERIGFVFQFFNLLPTLTLAENIALPLLLAGAGAADALARARSLAERVGVGHRLSHYPQQLSGGELQRAAIARAVIHQPALLVADEPTGNLDSENGARVLELLAGLNAEAGLTILLATHSPELAAAAHRIVHLRDGRIQRIEANPGGRPGAVPLFRSFILRRLPQERLRSALTVAGVALGIAVVVAIRLANQSSVSGFAAALDAMTGAASLEIVGPAGGLDELRLAEIPWLERFGPVSPVIEGDALARPDGAEPEAVRVLAVDILRDRPFRQYELLEYAGGARQPTPQEFLSLLSDPDSIVLTARVRAPSPPVGRQPARARHRRRAPAVHRARAARRARPGTRARRQLRPDGHRRRAGGLRSARPPRSRRGAAVRRSPRRRGGVGDCRTPARRAWRCSGPRAAASRSRRCCGRSTST